MARTLLPVTAVRPCGLIIKAVGVLWVFFGATVAVAAD